MIYPFSVILSRVVNYFYQVINCQFYFVLFIKLYLIVSEQSLYIYIYHMTLIRVMGIDRI